MLYPHAARYANGYVGYAASTSGRSPLTSVATPM